MNNIGSIVFEAILKEAVTANLQAKMRAMPSEEDLLPKHPPSAEHVRKMKMLFAYERRKNIMRQTLSFAKAAAIALCFAITLLFAALLINPEVRAAVRVVIVEFFEGFTRIEFTEQDEVTGEARHFSPGYLPVGYTLESVTEYGLNCLSIYVDTNGNMLILEVGPPDTRNVDSEFLTYHLVKIEGAEYHINESVDRVHDSIILFTKDGLSFSLTGLLTKDELLKVALSLG